MSRATMAPPRPRTFADLWRDLGKIPLERIWLDPPVGTATVDDVVRIEVEYNGL